MNCVLLNSVIGYVQEAKAQNAVAALAKMTAATILLISEIRSTADVVHVLLLGVSLAVAAVPEGLPAILARDQTAGVGAAPALINPYLINALIQRGAFRCTLNVS